MASLWRRLGGKGTLLPNSRKMFPRLSDMAHPKKKRGYGGRKRKGRMTISRMIRGG